MGPTGIPDLGARVSSSPIGLVLHDVARNGDVRVLRRDVEVTALAETAALDLGEAQEQAEVLVRDDHVQAVSGVIAAVLEEFLKKKS